MIVNKVLEFTGLFLLISSEFLFLFDIVLRQKKSSLNKYITKIKERVDRLLASDWFFVTLIIIIILVTSTIYIVLVNKFQNISFSEIRISGLISGILFLSVLAGIIYAYWLKFCVWLMENWNLIKNLLSGSIQKRLIVSIAFSFLLLLILLVIFLFIYNYLITQKSDLQILIGLIAFILSGVSIVSFIVVLIFLLLMSILLITSSRKIFWTSLFIMWSLGGASLLVNIWL